MENKILEFLNTKLYPDLENLEKERLRYTGKIKD